MAFKQSNFNGYAIRYNTGQLFEAIIEVFGEKGMVGEIRFVKNNKPVPAPQIVGGSIYIYYTISRFNDVITILRVEKPLNLMADTDAKQGSITTTLEPVGEEEGK